MIQRFSRAAGVLVTSASLALGGLATFAGPTLASEDLDQAAGTCVVNSGDCNAGICVYNSGKCGGGICAVNTGFCGPGCIAAVNIGTCGTSTCSGTGQAILSTGIRYYPDVTVNVGFTFTFNCLEGGSFTGTGTLVTASCGRSSGSGVTNTGIAFTVETVGSMLVAIDSNGEVIAAGNATPIPDLSTNPPGNTCSSGTAKVFQLTGGAVFL